MKPCPFNIVRDLPDPIEAWNPSFLKIDSIANYPEVFDWIASRGYDPYAFEKQHDMYYPLQEKMMAGRVIFKVETLYHHAYQAYRFRSEVDPKVFTPKEVKLTDMLYNYNEVVTHKRIFLCEGIFDVARLKSWSISAVALLGAEVSERQNQYLHDSLADEIVFCLDSGLFRKSLKYANRLRKLCSNKVISVLDIEKEGADPDTLTHEEFMEYFEKRTYVPC